MLLGARNAVHQTSPSGFRFLGRMRPGSFRSGQDNTVAEVASPARREGLDLLAVDACQARADTNLCLWWAGPVPKSYGVQALDPHASAWIDSTFPVSSSVLFDAGVRVRTMGMFLAVHAIV